MNYLLDTNIVSEATKPRPNAGIEHWLAAQPNESLFLSVVTVGEILRGLLQLEAGKKKRTLQRWLDEEIHSVFAGRILPVDTVVMEHWAKLQSGREKSGQRLPAMDSLIAATAMAHDLTLVTRNISDFQSVKLSLLNPWRP